MLKYLTKEKEEEEKKNPKCRNTKAKWWSNCTIVAIPKGRRRKEGIYITPVIVRVKHESLPFFNSQA
jgi:hypothetical protein